MLATGGHDGQVSVICPLETYTDGRSAYGLQPQVSLSVHHSSVIVNGSLPSLSNPSTSYQPRRPLLDSLLPQKMEQSGSGTRPLGGWISS